VSSAESKILFRDRTFFINNNGRHDVLSVPSFDGDPASVDGSLKEGWRVKRQRDERVKPFPHADWLLTQVF